MNLQQYVNKVQEWIDQGRLELPPGAQVIVHSQNGGFYTEVVYTNTTQPPVALAADIVL
jgi:hypothetical protein